ncbi:uncharacterized oxidoreductase YoxD-like [Phlebotomus argentipes]|uniref:uncharacterized oxidoreductase YoxD-like n=1 Tax=Phlebotomus argentipes TaxID=94469 RepID=UPI002893825C|nr:uncharacterized oxidoreductase YoxD-like [Phlebotomus argentipes]
MQNVFDSGKVAYEAAPMPKTRTLDESAVFYLSVLKDVVIVLLVGVPMLFLKLIKNLLTSEKNVAGQLALVTGGGNGIGREIALRLAKEKCNIAIADVDYIAGENTVEECLSLGVKAKFFKADVGENDEVMRLQENIEKEMGFVDILVNNAGLMPLLSIREGSSAEIERIIHTNFHSHIWTCRAFVGGMIERKKGHIICIASATTIHPMPRATIYSGTKGGVAGMMMAFEEELRGEGHGNYIKFTTVYPYFVSTRKDLMENLNLRFPAVTAKDTARVAVKAMLRNQKDAGVPEYLFFLSKVNRLLTAEVQQLVRDRIFREKNTLIGVYRGSN